MLSYSDNVNSPCVAPRPRTLKGQTEHFSGLIYFVINIRGRAQGAPWRGTVSLIILIYESQPPRLQNINIYIPEQ